MAGTFLSLSYWDYYWTLLVLLAASHGLVLHASQPVASTVQARPTLGWRAQAALAPPR